MAYHVRDEANRCLNCGKPMCMEGCPIHTPIPKVISLLKEGKIDEAGWMLFENNPLTTVCSLVCNHENQCEGNCVLGRKGSPVHFFAIENYISVFGFDFQNEHKSVLYDLNNLSELSWKGLSKTNLDVVFIIYYDIALDDILIMPLSEILPAAPYFPSRESAEKVINIIGKNKLKSYLKQFQFKEL